jgi:alanyl-tRNA synthetase
VPATDVNDLSAAAQRLAGETATVVALVGDGGEYLAVAAGDGADAGAVVDDVTAEFGGGGGGGPNAAQAGGLDGRRERIVAFLRGEE